MPVVAVIPVKSFSLGKRRLSAALSEGQRGTLARAMTEHVAGVAEEAGMIPILVTADARVAEWAARTAIPSVPDPGNGLSEAAAAGARWANRGASRWIILHSDLPLLSAPDLNTFWERALEADAIAPSSDGGTSAITSRGPMEFSYGPGSFSRHLADLDNPSIVATTGFLHDLDSPADLESVCDHPRGRWLLDVIG